MQGRNWGKLAEQTAKLATMGQTFVICGVPRAGKTTAGERLAGHLGCDLSSTDVLIGTLDWSGVSERVSTQWMVRPAPWVIEGVAAVRALRKWLKNNPEGKPCDVAVWMPSAKVPTSRGQRSMGKACETIWTQVAVPLADRGVSIVLGV